MSELFPVIDIEYKNRKPSKAVIMRTISEYMKQGGRAFCISWGENVIELDYHPKRREWFGRGWIKNIGGDDIAQELNDIRRQSVEEIRTLNVWNS